MPERFSISTFIINGNKSLKGTIEVCGAKNSAMKMIAASIIIAKKVTLKNVPDISDINILCEILTEMGAKISRSKHILKIDTTNLKYHIPNPKLVKSIRASVVLIGPLLARFGQAQISHPGGDKIGSRPINLHINAFKKLGVKITYLRDEYNFKLDKPKSAQVNFPKITVTGTENILIFSAGQNIETEINNAAIEPEVIDLIEFLNKSGANIRVIKRKILIRGNNNLKGVSHTIIPDRIEAGTFAVLGALTNSNLKIINCNPNHLKAFLKIFSNIGIKYHKRTNYLEIFKTNNFKPCNISTQEYPGLATDLQPPLGLLLTQANGASQIKENIFENRLNYLNELKRMGAKIKIINLQTAFIFGPSKLFGANINSLDIRAGVTLIIAGLLASGKTKISQAENIDRGYENIENRLKNIGADITRI